MELVSLFLELFAFLNRPIGDVRRGKCNFAERDADI